MRNVKPKKALGQHFLTDANIARQIVDALTAKEKSPVLEIGPGTGILTALLLRKNFNLKAIDVDVDSVHFLRKKYPEFQASMIEGNFLKINIDHLFSTEFSIIGNFPYNISSQIFFKVLDHKDQILEIVCMLQREVANRIISPPGNRTYGILSVFLQSYYDMEKITDVSPDVFSPPPKIWSSVIRLKRNQKIQLQCNEKLFRSVVKMSFQMRRKTLRNALKGLNLPASITGLELLSKRAEQLTVSDFESLTDLIEKS